MARRTTHPFALPPRDGSPNPQTEALVSDPVEGPQYELCKKTKCAVCWAVDTLMSKYGVVKFYERAVLDMSVAPDGVYYGATELDWRDLPEYGMRVSDPHHEPFRTQGGTDRHTVSLCPPHHTGLLAPGETSSKGIWTARHHTSFRGFWGFYGFLRVRPDGLTVLEALREEMRRRARER